MTGTFIALGLFLVVAFVPKVPWYVKVGLQVIIGLVIYFGFQDHEFVFPMGDTLPFSSLFGGNFMGLTDGVAFISMGFVGTLLGLVATAVATLLYKVLGKKSED